MLNSLLVKIAKMALGKNLLQVMSAAHQKLNGSRTEILFAALLLVHLLKMLQLIDEEVANQIEALLGGGLPLAMLSRVNKIIQTADAVVPKLPSDPPQK